MEKLRATQPTKETQSVQKQKQTTHPNPGQKTVMNKQRHQNRKKRQQL